MGKRGPAPTPKKLNDLRGDPGKRRRYTQEPIVLEGWPELPDHIKADALAHLEWRKTCQYLESMGLLAPLQFIRRQAFRTT